MCFDKSVKKWKELYFFALKRFYFSTLSSLRHIHFAQHTQFVDPFRIKLMAQPGRCIRFGKYINVGIKSLYQPFFDEHISSPREPILQGRYRSCYDGKETVVDDFLGTRISRGPITSIMRSCRYFTLFRVVDEDYSLTISKKQPL